jgi:hypothetical protein
MRKLAGMMLAVALGLTATSAQALQIEGCWVTDYGNGVYYLKCSDVGPALSNLKAQNPDATISFASYAGTQFGTSGYYVIVSPAPAAQPK